MLSSCQVQPVTRWEPDFHHIMQFEHVSCNLCGSHKSTQHLVRADLNIGLEGRFRLVECEECGLVYQRPRPTIGEFGSLYPPGYDQYPPNETSTIGRFEKNYGLDKRIRLIQQYVEHGKLLDVGCATGSFLARARELDWDVAGIEPSPAASEYARGTRKLDVHTGTLDSFPFPTEKYDVITMWNVIEHIPNPGQALKKTAELLKPEGLLVITTPRLGSWEHRVFGEAWIGYELPRHFFVFSSETLSRLLNQSGFFIHAVRCAFGTHAAAVSSLRFWMRMKHTDTRFVEIVSGLLFSLPARILLSPMFFILDALRLSGSTTYLCLKSTPE